MSEFDPGPPPAFAKLFARVPDYAPYKERFWYDWGPVFYRGRLDGSARVLGDDSWGRRARLRHNNSVEHQGDHTLIGIAPRR